METAQLQDYSRDILSLACQSWGLSSPQKISQAENLVFSCQSPRGKIALRLTHPLHRDASSLQAELDWIDHLAAEHVPVIQPVPSLKGQHLETVESNGKVWHAAAFNWIEGQPVSTSTSEVSDASVQEWGSLTAQIVAASLHLNRANTRFARHHWNEVPNYSTKLTISYDLASLGEETTDARHSIADLATTPENYLLAHTDLHSGNVFKTLDGTLLALDFDDCCYHYVAQEIAMPLYYSLFHSKQAEKDYAKHFFQNFLLGYRKFHDVPAELFDTLPLFFRLRDLDLKAISILWNVPPESDWYQRTAYLYEQGNPISQFPWSQWAKQI